MITKHTPATWIVTGNNIDGFVVREENSNVIVFESNRYLIQAEYNAKLIAAAPDLLELLTNAEHMINKSVSGLEKYSVIEWQLFLAKAQAAITKATGQKHD